MKYKWVVADTEEVLNEAHKHDWVEATCTEQKGGLTIMKSYAGNSKTEYCRYLVLLKGQGRNICLKLQIGKVGDLSSRTCPANC